MRAPDCPDCGRAMTPQHMRDTGDALVAPAGACRVLFERRNRTRPPDADVWTEQERELLLAVLPFHPLP